MATSLMVAPHIVTRRGTLIEHMVGVKEERRLLIGKAVVLVVGVVRIRVGIGGSGDGGTAGSGGPRARAAWNGWTGCWSALLLTESRGNQAGDPNRQPENLLKSGEAGQCDRAS